MVVLRLWDVSDPRNGYVAVGRNSLIKRKIIVHPLSVSGEAFSPD